MSMGSLISRLNSAPGRAGIDWVAVAASTRTSSSPVFVYTVVHSQRSSAPPHAESLDSYGQRTAPPHRRVGRTGLAVRRTRRRRYARQRNRDRRRVDFDQHPAAARRADTSRRSLPALLAVDPSPLRVVPAHLSARRTEMEEVHSTRIERVDLQVPFEDRVLVPAPPVHVLVGPAPQDLRPVDHHDMRGLRRNPVAPGRKPAPCVAAGQRQRHEQAPDARSPPFSPSHGVPLRSHEHWNGRIVPAGFARSAAAGHA